MTEQQPVQETTEAPAAEATVSQEPTSVAELPGWAQDLIKKTRDEAAKYRSERTTAVESAKLEVQSTFEAKLSEAEKAKAEFEKQVTEKDLSLSKYEAALEVVGIQEDVLKKASQISGLIKGSNDEEIAASAQELSGLFAGSAPVRTPAVDKTPAGKTLALNDDDGLTAAITQALGN